MTQTEPTDTQYGVIIRRSSILVDGENTVEGWVAEFDGTEAKGISREEALRSLVKAVGQEVL